MKIKNSVNKCHALILISPEEGYAQNNEVFKGNKRSIL